MVKINLEEILISKLEENSTEDFDLKIISKLHFIACYYAMEEACKQVLKLAAENANLIEFWESSNKEYIEESVSTFDDDGDLQTIVYVNKQSILDTIKQVE